MEITDIENAEFNRKNEILDARESYLNPGSRSALLEMREKSVTTLELAEQLLATEGCWTTETMQSDAFKNADEDIINNAVEIVEQYQFLESAKRLLT